jgi:hypothetical protein
MSLYSYYTWFLKEYLHLETERYMRLEKLAYWGAYILYPLSDVIRTMQGRELSEWIHLTYEKESERDMGFWLENLKKTT